MALTQMQLIQSLGEAMSWFERELEWGVEPTELRHLCGRIGELYVALITNGQMAPEVNQRGYDVVSAVGERISVKTTAQMRPSFAVNFNANSLEFVDRVIVLRMNTEEMQIEVLLDKPIVEVIPLFTSVEGKKSLMIGGGDKRKTCRDVSTVNQVTFDDYLIRELESGTIEVEYMGETVSPVKPILRDLAARLNVGLFNGKGNVFNTRQLGTQIIKSLQALNVNTV